MAKRISLTKAETEELEAEIGTGPGMDKFCEAWPAAKEVLEKLEDLAKRPIAKISIGTVIQLGDAAFNKNCG